MDKGLILNPIFIPGISYGFTTKFLENNSHEYITDPEKSDYSSKKIRTEQNQASLARLLNIKPTQLCFVHQIHSNIVINRNNSNNEIIQADAQVTDNPELVLTAQTADCVPILFYDYKNKIIGSAHAGWRGAKANIISNTVKNMLKNGANEHNIIAIIGPHIAQENYEVGDEFIEEFIQESPDYNKYFDKLSAKYHFNLGQFVIDKLNQFKLERIVLYNHDTFINEYWFSFRRFSKKIDSQYGSILSFIKLWS